MERFRLNAQYLAFIFLIQFIVSSVSQLLSIKKFVLKGPYGNMDT